MAKSPNKKTEPPRPKQNADGQAKQPSQNPTGGAAAAPQPGRAPSLVPPGGPAPMDMVQTRINFKDLPPMAQAQQEEMQGMNPAAPLQMIQGQLQSSMQEPGAPAGPPQQGPVPPSFIGPMVPPGVENFPHDMAALTQVMGRGYAPGADNAEHAMAQNAHAIARASEAHAQNQAAQGAQQAQVMQSLGALMQQLSMHGSIPSPEAMAQDMHRKQLQSSMGGPPPTAG